MTMLRLGTIWCAGLALLLPAPWAWLYGTFAVIGTIAWATADRSSTTVSTTATSTADPGSTTDDPPGRSR